VSTREGKQSGDATNPDQSSQESEPPNGKVSPELRGSRHDILLKVLPLVFIGFFAIVVPAGAGALPSGE
jgi:hypothetical protein